MDERGLQFLKDLLATPSPSGYEQVVQRVVRDFVAPFAASIRTDWHGNVIAAVNPEGHPRVMLAGHCDQIGLMVKHIDDNGYVWVDTIGGWDIQMLIGQNMVIWGRNGPVKGVIARKAIHLLSQDDRFRYPFTWECDELHPPLDPATMHTDPRVARSQKNVDRSLRLAPTLDAAHPMGAWEAQECALLHAYDFASATFAVMFNCQGYGAWLAQQDRTWVYERQKLMLQYMQSGGLRPAESWLLKTPPHMEQIDKILTVFPDARFVTTYREPTEVVASSCSLSSQVMAMARDEIDWHQHGRLTTYGVTQSLRLLLAGVVVGVVLGSGAALLTLMNPDILRAMQAFMLGSTGYVGWSAVQVMAVALGLCLLTALGCSRTLDALTLGEDTARSLGQRLTLIRLLLIAALSLATGAAVAQCGLIAFVGLVAPHLVRSWGPTTHGALLLLSALTGGALLLAADIAARWVIAPQELPVGIITALLGGSYLLWLMHRRKAHFGGAGGSQ